ncbi:LPS sulfotransferase NodH [Roseovarius nanhaiticus]|uniref:LPS sulfotransferase NodH n=1 Tax=Roseovarius nanhaiticus TaxID=573024 RepID=A0A1N7GXX7_9RHOB|nr:Stf0 family sulfotransferase [Roseovarius nanhaiticus]SEL20183.1 LPS sulfotransferase NodH [Roseovarius nanhaiticus]SIS17444.1 LPS sulfotransferase NodH [Roseovarius nanhaiticus]
MPSTPLQSYMICTAPRSGSTLLCRLLAATKIAGNPDSHFHSPSLDDWLDDYGLKRADYADTEDCLRALINSAIARGKGGTDIFGLRLQRPSFDYVMQQLGRLLPGQMRDARRIEQAFGATLYIHLTRSDRLGQAISYVRAEQTGLWHRNADGTELERLAPAQDARYDAAAIRGQMAALTALDAAWERWFEREGIRPLRLTYDALSEQPQRILAEVLAALYLDPGHARSVEPPTAKLADDVSRAWRDRFESES